MVSVLESVAESVFNAFLSTQSMTRHLLGQKEFVKGPIREEGSVETDKFKRYLKKNPKCLFC